MARQLSNTEVIIRYEESVKRRAEQAATVIVDFYALTGDYPTEEETERCRQRHIKAIADVISKAMGIGDNNEEVNPAVGSDGTRLPNDTSTRNEGNESRRSRR